MKEAKRLEAEVKRWGKKEAKAKKKKQEASERLLAWRARKAA